MRSLLSRPVAFAGLGALLLWSCTTTLDLTGLDIGPGSDGEGGGAGEGNPPLSACSVVEGPESAYLICQETLDFEAATHDCELRDASLAAVGSAAENDFIAAAAYGIVGSNIWMGGTRDDDYVWRWPDGSVFWRGGRDGVAEGGAYVRWQPGEPNDASTVTSDPERCLALTPEGNDWNDRACSLNLPYVCEQGLEAP